MAPKIKVDPELVSAAQQFALEHGVTPGGSSTWKLGCAYQACNRTFDPKGSGPWHHGSCPVGGVFFGSISKALKEHGKDSLEHKAALKVAEDFAAKLDADRKAKAS